MRACWLPSECAVRVREGQQSSRVDRRCVSTSAERQRSEERSGEERRADECLFNSHGSTALPSSRSAATAALHNSLSHSDLSSHSRLLSVLTPFPQPPSASRNSAAPFVAMLRPASMSPTNKRGGVIGTAHNLCGGSYRLAQKLDR